MSFFFYFQSSEDKCVHFCKCYLQFNHSTTYGLTPWHCCEMKHQDRQRTYNAILRRGLNPLLQGKIEKYYILWVCICSVGYPVCNAHSPYCIAICGLPDLQYLSTLSIKGRIFEKKKQVLNTICFHFLYKFFWNISHYKRNWARYCSRSFYE
jgi:hypothetical protein